MFSLVCLDQHHRQGVNFENFSFQISGKCHSGGFLLHFLHVISAVFFVIKLVVLVPTLSHVWRSFSRDRKFCFKVSWLGQEKTSWNFVFNWFIFFLMGKITTTKKFDNSPPPPPPQKLFRIEINSSETCINNVQVFLNGHLLHVQQEVTIAHGGLGCCFFPLLCEISLIFFGHTILDSKVSM